LPIALLKTWPRTGASSARRIWPRIKRRTRTGTGHVSRTRNHLDAAAELGGVALIEMLNILERWAFRNEARLGGVTAPRDGSDASRVSRSRPLPGRSDFVEVPVQKLTSKQHARELAKGISLTKASSSASLARTSSRPASRRV
jgi:gamma-glutamyltranspeptidase